MSASPITGSDLGPVTSGSTACDHLAELVNTRKKMQELLEWLLEDDGTLGDDFKEQLIQTLIFDAAKKGWFVRTNPTTGFLELVEKVPLTALADGNEEGDVLVWNGDEWEAQGQGAFSGPPTSGGTTPPDPNDGGTVLAAHGLEETPDRFGAYLECTTAENGYAVGDRIDACSLSGIQVGGTDDTVAAHVWANATQVGVTFAKLENSNSLKLWRKDDYTKDTLTPANWKVVVWAEL